jgi:putative acetyltransferase
MKRLFVRPEYRGRKLGIALARAIISEAAKRGYGYMRLDTLDKLTEAIRLYEQLEFKRIAPYYHNPLTGVSYWELLLKPGMRREHDLRYV